MKQWGMINKFGIPHRMGYYVAIKNVLDPDSKITHKTKTLHLHIVFDLYLPT